MLALIIQRIRKHRAWILALSAVVVFCTTYALILPALTLEQDEAAKQGGIDLPKTEQSADKQDTDVSGDPQSKDAEKKDVKAEEPSDSAKTEKSDPKEADKTDSAKADKTGSESDKDGLAFEGKGYSITAKAGSDAKLPEDTELSAKEVKSDEKDYEAWVDEAEKALKESPRVKYDVSVKSAKFYNITLMSDGREVEPAADVNVKITYDKALKMSKSGDVYVVHFGVDKNGKLKPEVLKENAVEVKSKAGQKKGTIEVSDISFDASGFSMYGVLETSTLEETVMTADGKNYKISVTYDADAKVPEGAKLSVSEIGSDESGYDDYVAKSEDVLGMDKGSAGYARLFDIKIVDKDGDKVKIQAPVDVKIELEDKGEKGKTKIVHFADGSDKGDVIKAEVKNDTLSFEAEGFSVYAVIGGTEPTARMQINFHGYDENGNEKVTSIYVKKEDTEDELEMILYDPGVGKLNDRETFRGWTPNEDYTAAQGSSAYDKDSNPNGAMTIEDIRDWAKDKQESIVEDPMQVYDFYPIILKHLEIKYLDRFGVAIDTDSAYMLRDETEAQYTVNKVYSTGDDDYHFKGWITDDENNIVSADPEPETVTVKVENPPGSGKYIDKDYKLYTNNTKVELSGDVTLQAHAPKGKWLVFHEVEKGATYVAPQFLEEGEEANMPDDEDMHLLGYTFGGWYRDEEYTTPYNGEPINEKTDVYAKWVPTTWAPYTVIIWKQNLDGTYAYQESVQLYGTVGEKVQDLNSLRINNNNDADFLSISGKDKNKNDVNRTYQTVHSTTGNSPNIKHHYYYMGTTTDSDYVGFNCARIDFTEKDDNNDTVPVVIDAAGTKVVNVYYDRIEYSVKLYLVRRAGNNNTNYFATYRSNNNGNRPELVIGNGGNGMDWDQNFTYNDNLFPSNMQWETRGNERYSYVEVKAKYGADISSQWPRYDQLSDLRYNNTNYHFTSWYTMNAAGFYQGAGSGKDSFKGIITIMNEQILGDITTAEGANYLIGRYDNNVYYYNYEIWKETVEGEDYSRYETKTVGDKTYYHDEANDIYSRSSAKPSGAHAPSYRGFEYQEDMDVRPPDPSGNPYGTTYNIEFYYDRVANPIVFRDGAYFDGNGNRLSGYTNRSPDEETDDITFESDVSSYNKGGDNYNDTYKPAYPGFVLEGWYTDEACTAPYTFDKMPDSSITVYAKWRQVQYRAFLHPQVPKNKTVSWGSDAQEMNFRISYGDHVSCPEGKLVDPTDPDVIDDSYEFAGWYRDPQYTQPFDGDAFVLNDEITVPYDKSTDMTDDMDKYGNITGGGPNGEGYNSDAMYFDEASQQWVPRDRWWITKKLDLYGKWIKKMDAGTGIQIIYDPNGGSDEVKDDTLYKDGTHAVAQSAPVTPPEGKKFLYWVLQKWDPDGGEEHEGAFVDIDPMEFVYPGDTFDVLYSNAQTVETVDPDTGEKTYEYFIHLRAEYEDPERETPTHIWWYSNFGDNDVIKKNDTDTAEDVEDVGINEAVNIKPEDTFTREGYKFLGWARVDSTDDEGEPIEGHPALHPELGPDDLFLKYVEAGDDTSAHFEAKDSDNEWVTVTQIAADEKYPYHDLYAVWAKLYSVTVIKNVVGTDDDKDRTYSFESTGLTPDEDTFSLYGREKTDNNEVTQTNRKVYTDIPQYTEFQVTEDDYTSDFVTTIEATYTYVNDKGETVTETIALDPDRDNKLSTGELTVNGNTTITYTNTRKALKVSVWKTDEGHAALTGAKFVLYKAEDYDDTTEQPKAGATPVMAETEVGFDGLLLLDVVNGEIPLGEYRLVETVAPAGYNLADSAIRIVLESGVSATQDGNVSEVYVKGDQYWVARQDDDTHQIRVWNNPGVELPSSGGPGTTWIYLIGSILLLGCSIMLISRRRIRSN